MSSELVIEEHHEDISLELKPVDIDISFSTEEGKFFSLNTIVINTITFRVFKGFCLFLLDKNGFLPLHLPFFAIL